jgi:hypothetical protein
MAVDYEYDRNELDRDIRELLSKKEISRLVQQLQGAVAAMDLLRAKAPHVVDAFFAELKMVDASGVSGEAQHALSVLADRLRAARAHPKPIPSRQALRLAFSAEGPLQ